MSNDTEDPKGICSIYRRIQDRDLRIYTILPRNWHKENSRPAILFFHGGGWAKGTPALLNEQAEFCASKGLVCFLVEYQLISKGETPEQPMRDAKAAMRWVRSNASNWGVDPNRIAAGGGSAGAHLAAVTAMVPGFDDAKPDPNVSPKPQALILFNPVLDCGPNGFGYSRMPDCYRQYSPIEYITSDAPPTLIMTGSADATTKLTMVQDFETRMHGAGARCDVIVYEGQDHGFFRRRPGQEKYCDLTLMEIGKFLESMGWAC